MIEHDLLTLPQIAEMLRLNPSTVRGWVNRGQLPAQKVDGKKWLVYRQDLEALLAAQPRLGKPHRSPGTPASEQDPRVAPEDWSEAPNRAVRDLASSARLV